MQQTQPLMSDSHLPKKVCFICFIDSPLKIMENAFYFILKKLYLLSRYLNLCHDFFVMLKKWLDQKGKVNFKIHDVTIWLTITIHILPNISRSKDNQTMKIGQLTEYIKKTIFLQKLCREQGRETSSRLLFVF